MSAVPARVNAIRSMDDDAVSRAYARQMARFRKGYDATARRAHDAAPDASGILDAATGPGLSLPELVRLYPEADITALDISEHMLARARETLEAAGLTGRVTVAQGSVYAIPAADGSYDLVLASQLIHMLDDLPAFLAEARRVLAPGGLLLIVDFRRDVPGWYRALARLSTWILTTLRVPMAGMGPVIAASWTPSELESAIRHAGFDRPSVSAGIADPSAEAR